MKVSLRPLLLTLAGLALASCTSMDGYRPGSSTSSTTSSSASRSSARATEASAPKAARAGYLSARMAFPTGDPKTSALLVEKLTPKQVRVGEEFEYETRVVNLTDLPLENVVVTELMAGGFERRSSTPHAASSERGQGRWMIGDLAPGATRSITVRGVAKSAEALRTCVSVDYDTALCSSIDVVQPSLKLVAQGPSAVIQCEDIVYNYTVTNTGTGTAQDVVVTGKLPEGLTAAGSSTFQKRIGSLASGKSSDFQIKARAGSTGRFVHAAEAKTDAGLTTRSGEVATTVTKPKLEILHTGPKVQFAGRDTVYEVVVRNVGNGVARDTVLEQTVPSGLDFEAASEGGRQVGRAVRWTLGQLKPNESRRLTTRFGSETTGSLTSTARAKAFCADEVSASVQTELKGIPAILLEVVDLEDPIVVGQNETYVITVTNQGSAAATNVKIDVTLPANTQLIDAKGATSMRGSVSGRSFSLAPVASVPPKGKVSWRIQVRATEASDARFKVSMTSDQLRTPVEETEATTFYE